MTKLKTAFLLLMCSYGCLGLVVRAIALPTVVIVWARALVSSLALLLFLLFSGKADRKAFGKSLLPMVVSGVFLAVDWIGLFASYRYTTIATATLCYYIVPVLVMLGAAVLLGERLSARQVVCIVIASVGYAGVILINKKYPEGDSILRTFVQLCTAAVIMSAYVLKTTDLRSFSPNAKDIVLLLVLGVLMTAAAYIAYFYLIVRIPSASVAFFSYADPVVAVFVSLIFLGEPFSVFTLLGGAMIIGAAVVSEFSAKPKKEQKPSGE